MIRWVWPNLALVVFHRAVEETLPQLLATRVTLKDWIRDAARRTAPACARGPAV